jgi:hypothetical protein
MAVRMTGDVPGFSIAWEHQGCGDGAGPCTLAQLPIGVTGLHCVAKPASGQQKSHR